MSSSLDYLELVSLHVEAQSCIWNVLCSLEDEYTPRLYLYTKTKQAIYDATEMLLLLHEVPVPNSAIERVEAVRNCCKGEIVPKLCDSFLSDSRIGRQEIGYVAQSVDCWIGQLSQKYSYFLENRTLRHQAVLNVG